nr:immunoglobulin light chain junction region [Macaca mulatta]MOX47842.1 immunoglobulin light chain junction region [Macaca mulatta]MOX47959.1 immunoglobulin light chain junction region [Macaca mulatta]MOX48507.1 immunoglobulin light chain junction region [Macaca mulatta]MOX48688.1 immunoglobulin light chain junction region [Macaca mulatta]
CQQHNAYPRTF